MRLHRDLQFACAIAAFSASAFAAVGVNKSFTPNSVVAGQASTLTIVLLNPNPSAATGVALTDTLPSGVVVANPLTVASNTCGFTVNATPGTRPIALTGGTIPAISGGVPGQCQLTINVVSSTPNTYLNTIAANAVSSSQGNNAQDAQATLVVSRPANITGSKAFLPTNVHGNGSGSTLTITLTNPNPIPLTNAALTDSLPAAITVAAAPNAATTCGAGTATPSPAASNPATIALSGGTIPANGSCTMTVDIVSRNPNALTNGNQTNTIAAGALTTTEGATSPAITANINVQTGAQLTKAFAPTPVAPNGASSLTITVTNFNSSVLTPIAFTDTLPVTIKATALPVSSCGGTIATVPAQPAPPPYTAFTLSGGSLAGVVGPGPGTTTCTITAPVTASASGTNTIPAGNYGGVAIAAASGTLSVSAITGSKSFTTPALQTGTMTMTITLNNLTAVPATITSLRDDLTTMGAGFTVQSGATPGGTCGVTLTSPTPGTLITSSGGTIPANGSCTIILPLDISPTAATGNRTDTIAIANNAVNGVHTTAGNNAVTITGVVNVQRALTVTKAFNPASVQGGTASRLTVTMTPTVSLTGAGFIDDLTTMGAGFTVLSTGPGPNPVANNCGGGTVTANPGATSFSLAGGVLTAGLACTVAVNVATPVTTGVFTNRITAANMTTTQGVTTSDVTANLTLVSTSVTVNKSFSPTTVAVGAPNFSTLSVQIRNNNVGAIALTGVGLTDLFPLGMAIFTTPTASFTGAGCSGATITAPAGATQISISGANVNANSICTLSVRVVANIAGNLIDTVPATAISSAQGVTNPLQGTATLAATGTVNLTITKTDGVASVVPGGATTYTIGVSNAGPGDVTGLAVNDAPPAGMSFASWTCTASAGSACPASGSGPIAASVTVLHGGAVTFTVVAAIAPGATGSITNTASLAVPGSVIDTNPVRSASDTDTLTPQVDLAISKTDGVASAVPGTSTSYTIVVSNAGPSDVVGATVADVLPPTITGATWTCAATLGSSCPASGSGSVNAAVNLLAGGSATFTLVATISSTASGTLSNTATVTAPVGVTDTNPANNSASDVDTLTPQADLAISKTDGMASVNAGASTTYTIVASNNGPSAVVGATVTDNAPAGLTLGGWTCVASAGSSCPASGSGNIAAAVNLLAGGSATFTANATVGAGATGSIANTATIAVPIGVSDPIPGNNAATDTDTVALVADLAITKTDGVGSVDAGGTTTYSIVVSNAGPSAANNAVFTDPAVANLSVSSVNCGSASGGAACPTALNTTIALMQGSGIVIPALPAGGSVTFTVNANVAGGATGTIVNTARIAVPAGVTDANAANNAATDSDTVALVADLAITKTDGVATATPGASTTYTIVARNNGPSNVVGATVSDVLPVAVTGATFTAVGSGGAAGFSASGSGNINDTIDLPVNATVTYTVIADISSGASGNLVNTATIAPPPGVTDTNAANNSATDTDTLTPLVTLAVVKTDGSASYTPGGGATYTVTVTATGPSDAEDVTVSDVLPAGVTLTASASCVANGVSDCGTLTGSIGQTSFGTSGAQIAAGMGNALVFSVPVAFAPGMVADPLVNTASATDVATGATASGADSDVLAPQVSLAVIKTDGSSTYTPGGAATYTVTISDGGLSNATNVTITDPLPAGVTLAANVSCVANGSASCGTVTGTSGQTSFGATGASIAAGPGNSLVLSAPVAFAAAMTADPLDNTATATDVLSGATGAGTDSDALARQVSLAVTKTDGSATYTPGGAATYTITVANTGLSDAMNVTISDALPAGVTLSANANCVAAGSANCGTITGSAGQSSLGATGASIAAGGGNALVFTAPVVFASDLADDPLINAATAIDVPSGASGSGSDSDARAAQAALNVSKSDGSSTYTPGASATYTIVVTNAGPSDTMNATVADPLPAGATLAANATCVASGTASCGTVTGATGQTSFGATGAQIAAGAGNALTFTAPVAYAPGMTANPLINAVTVTDPAMLSPATASDSDALSSIVDLGITKSDGVATVVPGTSTSYTIVVSNAGPSDVVGATVADVLPPTITGATWTCAATLGSSCPASGSGSVNAAVNLLAGGSATFTLVATISSTASGTLSNTATVTAPVGVTDTNPANNSASDVDTLTPQADLAISKTDGSATYSPGSPVTYTIVASNAGPSGVNGAMVADTLPAAILGSTWTCAGAGGGTCPASGSGNIAAVVNLPVGASVTFTLTGAVAPAASGNLVNTATVSAPLGVTDANPANNTATDTDTPASRVTLLLTKTDGSATYTPGGTAIYTITVANAGPSNASSVTVTDSLPSGAVLTGNATCTATGAASCGTITGTSGSSIVTATGATIAAGAGNGLTITLPVRFSMISTPAHLVNTVTATDPGSLSVASASDDDALRGVASIAIPVDHRWALALLALALLCAARLKLSRARRRSQG